MINVDVIRQCLVRLVPRRMRHLRFRTRRPYNTRQFDTTSSLVVTIAQLVARIIHDSDVRCWKKKICITKHIHIYTNQYTRIKNCIPYIIYIVKHWWWNITRLHSYHSFTCFFCTVFFMFSFFLHCRLITGQYTWLAPRNALNELGASIGNRRCTIASVDWFSQRKLVYRRECVRGFSWCISAINRRRRNGQR